MFDSCNIGGGIEKYYTNVPQLNTINTIEGYRES